MSRSVIERRLVEVSQRLARARLELTVVEEQLTVFKDTADDARVRALVSETPQADREHTAAKRHAEAMARSRDALAAMVARLEQAQDELLERLPARSA